MAVDEYQWLSIETHQLFLKDTRCTVDILSQILYYKTQDVGKISLVGIIRFTDGRA